MRERKKAVSIVDTALLTREEWLEYRKHGIGASDMPVIMGLSTFKSVIALFEEKVSRIPTSEIEKQIVERRKHEQEHDNNETAREFGVLGMPIIDPNSVFNLSTEIGHALEPIAAKYLSCKLGMPVFKDTAMYSHPDYPFIFVDLDYIMLMPDENGELNRLVIIECKTATYWKKEAWEKGVPESYEIQCRTAMAVLDVDEVIIICILDNNDGGVFTYQIYRDPAIELRLIMEAKRFWNGHVETQTLPLPPLPSKTAAAEMAVHAMKYPKYEPPVELFSEGLHELVDSYTEQHLICREIADNLDTENEKLEQLKLQLSTFMLNYDKANTKALKLSWSKKNSRSTDYEGLKIAYPEIYARFVSEKASLGFAVKVNEKKLESQVLKGAA